MKPALPLRLLLVCCVIISSCSAKEKIIGLQQTIHHDDFEYSVQRVERTKTIGKDDARGVFYIVTFQVENRALRVEHRWSNDIAYIVDEIGVRHDNDVDAQQELNRIQTFGYKNEHVT